MGAWSRLLGALFSQAREALDPYDDSVRFSAPRRDPRDAMLSFWADETLYQDIRAFGTRDASRLVRASVKLGLGLFRECPELMKTLDTRARQKHHLTLWVDEATAGRVIVVSGNQQSRFIRASVEFGLVFFRAHRELISTLDDRPEQ